QARALVDELRELNADRHKYDDETFQREKTRLEHAAAEALKSRDGRKAELAKSTAKTKAPVPTPKKDTWASRHPHVMGSSWGCGGVSFLWLGWSLLAHDPSVASAQRAAVASNNDPRYESLLVLSAIAISIGDSEKMLQFWEGYMRRPVPRPRPPM